MTIDLQRGPPLGMDRPIEPMDVESVSGALDELFLLARHYNESEQFLKLLRFVASFKRYSAFNAMLVYAQMPGARYVLPARQWQKKYGRVPKHDAQPLVMLQPKGPIMFGFDVSQTEGRPLPANIDNPFIGKGVLKQPELDFMVDNAKRDGVLVNLRSLGSTLGGYVRNADDPAHKVSVGTSGGSSRMMVDDIQVPVFAEVTLNANLPPETNFATLTHELGHLYCGHVGTANDRWWPDRRLLDRATREFEAESVSYIVCQRAGLDTPAVEYLNGYLAANREVPKISLEVVFKAVQRVEAMRQRKLKLRAVTRAARDGDPARHVLPT
jgi:hypothetical protein